MVREQTRRNQTGAAATKRLLVTGTAVCLSIVASFPAAAADDLLSSLVGSWIGRGTFMSSATAAPEPVYCKITNSLDSAGTTLQQRGRCAVSTTSSNIKGAIKANGGGRYDGSMESLSSTGPASISGTGGSGKLQLVADFVDRKTKKPAKSALSLVVAGGKYRLVSENVGPDGKKHTASDIVFTKQ